jgi:monofunctional glycosyltransferase
VQEVAETSTALPIQVSVWKKVLRWMRQHKLRTLLIVVLAVIFIELLTIPWFSVARLATENPAETALMRQRRKEADAEKKPYQVKQNWIPLSRVPRQVVDAIIVAEDGTFFEHGGIDWFEVQESLERNLEEGRAARGASTITQQLAKNLYLSTSKDPVRKLKEVLITLLMERFLTKQRILELYVNIIEWGRGVFGIDAAARAYFGKPASALTLEEGTRLAAVIPSPLRHRPDTDSRYVLRRKAIVLNRMNARRMAGAEEPAGGLIVPQPSVPQVDSSAVAVPDDTTNGQEADDDGL